MKRFIEGEDGGQGTLLPELLDDYVAEDNPVRVVDVFVEELDLASLGFGRMHRPRLGNRLTIPPRCSSSTFTATSIGFNRAGGLSARPRATSN